MNAMGPVYAALLSTGLAALALLALSCTSNPYYIGDSGGAVGAAELDPNLSFALNLDQSGPSLLAPELELAAGSVPATLRFRGEAATQSDWPAEQGGRLVKGLGTPMSGLDAPFTDGTRAVGFSSSSPGYVAPNSELGAVAGDDFALELVLRSAPGAQLLDKRAGGSGWSLALSPSGALVLSLQDEQRQVLATSEPLTADAWYHCLVWVSHVGGARADCNGRPGALSDLSALGSLFSSATLSVGGTATQLAYFALFRVASGELGPASSWAELSRRRFAALTGMLPRIARGAPLPRPGLRDSVAYLDLKRESGTARRLFLLGPDWPRIACRTDGNGLRVCGYLSEAERTRWVEPDARAWQASELLVSAERAEFADGEPRLAALIPSSALAPHTLSWTGSYAGARQVLSFFARAEAGQLVATHVGNRGTAIFDVRQGSVVSTPPDARASIEDWGGGLFRCSYVFEPEMGELSYALQLLDGPEGQPFAGDDQRAWLDLAGLQVDVGQAYAGSPLGSPNQAADQLSFIADDGNLPRGTSVSQRFTVLLPKGPRLTDQALLNLNQGGSFETQIQLYITGDTAELKFWGLRDGITHWAFDHPVSLVDGLRHAVRADWSPGSAQLAVDGVSLQQEALHANEPAFALDHIDISYSANSSGSLEGLISELQLGTSAQ